MPKINLKYPVKRRMAQELRSLGFPKDSIAGIIDDIILDFYNLLADDIGDGKSSYPVDTGYSEANLLDTRSGNLLIVAVSYTHLTLPTILLV